MPLKDKEAHEAYHAKYREEHREELAANAREYRRKNAEAIRARRRAKYRRDPERWKARSREWYQANRERAREANLAYRVKNWRKLTDRALRLKFGLSYEAYLDRLDRQDGRCWICAQPESAVRGCDRTPNNLAVDHDRKCCPGKNSCGRCVRRLLCQACNVTLGQVYERPEILHSMVAYIGEALNGGRSP